MLHSMTGYGRGRVESGGREFLVELKSVNHRYNDLYIKMPRELSSLEDRVRSAVGGSISRGKTDVYVTYGNHSGSLKKVVADENLAGSYIQTLQGIIGRYGLRDDISAAALARMPDVLRIEEADDDLEEIWSVLRVALDEAVSSFIGMRKIEGQKLADDLANRLKTLETLVTGISKRSPEVISGYRLRLAQRITELTGQQVSDESRLAMETAIFADRCSIDEEITRLMSHISQFSGIIENGGPSGKKLDFLVQEINREINTIASKANDIVITNKALDFKNELERIREQVQNIE